MVQQFRLPVINCQRKNPKLSSEMQVGQPQKGLNSEEILKEWPFMETFIPVSSSLYKQQQV